MDNQKTERRRAALVGIAGREESVSDVERSLAELERLADTAGADSIVKLI